VIVEEVRYTRFGEPYLVTLYRDGDQVELLCNRWL
jgi:hypothetical protein